MPLGDFCFCFVLKKNFRTCDSCSWAHAWMESFWVYGKCGQLHKSVLKNSYRLTTMQATQASLVSLLRLCKTKQKKHVDKATILPPASPGILSWVAIGSSEFWFLLHLWPFLRNSMCTSCGCCHGNKDTIFCIYFSRVSYFSKTSIKKGHLKVNWIIVICDSVESMFKGIQILKLLIS